VRRLASTKKQIRHDRGTESPAQERELEALGGHIDVADAVQLRHDGDAVVLPILVALPQGGSDRGKGSQPRGACVNQRAADRNEESFFIRAVFLPVSETPPAAAAKRMKPAVAAGGTGPASPCVLVFGRRAFLHCGA